MNSLSCDTIQMVSSFLSNASDKSALKRTSKDFSVTIRNIHIKIAKLNELLRATHWLDSCANRDCYYDICRLTNSRAPPPALGWTTFYYLGDEIEPMNDPFGDNWVPHATSHRKKACLKAPRLKRFVPYCLHCMHRYFEYGVDKTKGLGSLYTIPFGIDNPVHYL